MSMANNSPCAAAWEVPVYHEGGRQAGNTVGHRADQPGLRAHSVGDTWPYRVVGKGDGSWEVHRNGCKQVLSGMGCKVAHDTARKLANGRLTWLEV